MLSSHPTSGIRKNAPKQIFGLMQSDQLMISSLIEHAELYHAKREILSRLPEQLTGPLHVTNYETVHRRSKRLANALLEELGVSEGTVVATLAFNTFRHLEAYYGVSGIGAILHTINPRLFLDQLDYIINHAEDDVLLVDVGCLPVLSQLLERNVIKTKKFVIMTDEAHMPSNPKLKSTGGPTANKFGYYVWCYETLLARHSDKFIWPSFDENTASSLCYTSGTTGNPKGVLYSHRSTVLHSYGIIAQDTLAISVQDTILVIVPAFHANAWGTLYAACMTGAKLILPGPVLDGKTVCDLILKEKVTFTFAVPTVMSGLFQYMDSANVTSLGSLNRVTIGGAAPPRSMVARFMNMGVNVIQGWGLTESSPLGTTTGKNLPHHQHLPLEKRIDIACRAGRATPGVKMKILDEEGNELPRDGKTSGELAIAGPWITCAYYKLDSNLEKSGFFKTGDVAVIDHDGYMSITDRSKDVIKSGGEWISSIDLENEAANHPQVAQAAVIGVAHEKWTERPLLIVVRKPNATVTEAELLSWLSERVVKWWVPEAVEFVKDLPLTATGKIRKLDLRKTYANYKWPQTSAAQTAIQSKL